MIIIQQFLINKGMNEARKIFFQKHVYVPLPKPDSYKGDNDLNQMNQCAPFHANKLHFLAHMPGFAYAGHKCPVPHYLVSAYIYTHFIVILYLCQLSLALVP